MIIFIKHEHEEQNPMSTHGPKHKHKYTHYCLIPHQNVKSTPYYCANLWYLQLSQTNPPSFSSVPQGFEVGRNRSTTFSKSVW